MAAENESEKEESNAVHVDAQRARQMLDRALILSEQDKLADAIIACRRAVALAPDMTQAWSMLALFYEQNHNIDKAIVAYEKVLQIEPDSILEQESLQRLQSLQIHSAPAVLPDADNDLDLIDAEDENGTPLHSAAAPATTRWNSFYFRSFPLAIAAVACMVILAAAQHSAHVRESTFVKNTDENGIAIEKSLRRSRGATRPQRSAGAGSVNGDTENKTDADATQLSPEALAPHSDEDSEETDDKESPVPVPENSSENDAPKTSAQTEHKPAPKPKPKSEPAPKPPQQKSRNSSGNSQPFSVPALPRPQIKLSPRPELEPEQHSDSKNEPKSSSQKERDDSRADRPAPPLGEVGNAAPPSTANSHDNAPVPDVPSSFPDAARN